MLKVSIVTVVRNNRNYVEDCIRSVIEQSYGNLEYIIVDGASTDGTIDIIREYEKYLAKWVSEPDNGIYDAMNKGIKWATGDIVGILNADDCYTDKHVIEKVVAAFTKIPIACLFADLVYTPPDNLAKIVRYYSGRNFSPSKLTNGWMPPHPTVFMKRECYEKYGLFKTDYKIAADFELLVRFMIKYGISYHYLPEVIINMRTGGASTKSLKSNMILNNEIVRACRENGVKTNILRVYSKYFVKGFQLLNRPPKRSS